MQLLLTNQNRAIERLNAEIQADPKNKTIAKIGEHLIDRATADPAVADILCAFEGEIIAKSLAHLKNEARKTGKTSVCMTDEEGFDIIHAYLQLPDEIQKSQTAVDLTKGVDLDALLG